jgi:uncharacterized lipoprotein YmbA
MLAPVSSGAQGPAQNSTSLAIGLGPVQLPEYLDRPDLVIRTSANGFELSDMNRWAEPLPDNFRHVLAAELTNLLGNADIVEYPWNPGTRLDYVVRIEVQRFEADTSQTAQLIARWDLRTAGGQQLLASRQAQLSRPVTSLAGDAVAGALSQELGELAQQIASTITQVEQQRLASRSH